MNAICAFFTAYVERSSTTKQYLFTHSSQGFSLEPKSDSCLLRGVKQLCGTSYNFNDTAAQFLDHVVKKPPTDDFEREAYLKSCIFLRPIFKHVMQRRLCDNTTQLYITLKGQIKTLLADYSRAKNCPEITAACSLKLYQVALTLFKNGQKPESASLESLLQEAYKENKLDLALELVIQSAKPQSIQQASSLLAHAIHTKNQKATAILLSTPLDLSWKHPKQGNSLLHLAVEALDPDTTKALIALGADISQKNHTGQVPLEIGLHTKQDPTLFYMHFFGDHPHAQKQISAKGIQQFLAEVDRKEKMLTLEVALLFNSSAIAQKIAPYYSPQEHLHAQMTLAKKYPSSSCKTVAFSQLQIDHKHLRSPFIDIEIPPPEKKIEIEKLYSLYNQLKGAFSASPASLQKLERFIDRIKKRTAFMGTPKTGSPGIKTFYETIERALKNVLLYFESSAEKDAPQSVRIAFIREVLSCVDLCGGRYFTTLVDQYFKICKKNTFTFEERITRSLAEYRNICLQSVIDPSKEHNLNDYNYFMRMRGRELGIMGFQNYETFSDEFGFVDIQKTETKFWQLYSPENICSEWILPLLKDSGDLRGDFIDWHKAHVPDGIEQDEWLLAAAELKPYTISYFLCTMTPAVCR